jgi:hypothetical protein
MCLLWGTHWVFISQRTTIFIVTAVNTSALTQMVLESVTCSCDLLMSQGTGDKHTSQRDSDTYRVYRVCFHMLSAAVIGYGNEVVFSHKTEQSCLGTKLQALHGLCSSSNTLRNVADWRCVLCRRLWTISFRDKFIRYERCFLYTDWRKH